jgi:hypothetical protein
LFVKGFRPKYWCGCLTHSCTPSILYISVTLNSLFNMVWESNRDIISLQRSSLLRWYTNFVLPQLVILRDFEHVWCNFELFKNIIEKRKAKIIHTQITFILVLFYPYPNFVLFKNSFSICTLTKTCVESQIEGNGKCRMSYYLYDIKKRDTIFYTM